MTIRWPWQTADELAPGTSAVEAQANAKTLPPDGKDSKDLPRATEETHER